MLYLGFEAAATVRKDGWRKRIHRAMVANSNNILLCHSHNRRTKNLNLFNVNQTKQ